MSRMTTRKEILDELAFAESAAKHFAAHPEHSSFTSGEVEPGAFLGLRWGLGNDCVLVLKLDEYHEPTNYQELVRQFMPQE